jgi:hypothetical protein
MIEALKATAKAVISMAEMTKPMRHSTIVKPAVPTVL